MFFENSKKHSEISIFVKTTTGLGYRYCRLNQVIVKIKKS